jgi:hypothetical protein
MSVRAVRTTATVEGSRLIQPATLVRIQADAATGER